MSRGNLLIDIRASDEVLTKRFDGKQMTNYYNIPGNMIRFNIEGIISHLEYVDNIYIVCNSSRRSKIIKEKYFPNESRIIVDKNLQFKHFPNSPGMALITLENGSIEKIWLTGTFSFNLYNMTRVIQIILGTILLLCGLLLLNNNTVHIGIKTVLVGFGLMALFNGLTNTCTLALLLRNVMN